MTRVLTLLLAALALIVAGCGDDGTSKEDYVKEYNKVGETLEKTLSSLGTGITGSTDPKQISTKLQDGATALDTAADDLAEITPPDDAKNAHDNIISGVRDLANTFRTGAKQAGSGDLAKLVTTFSSLQGSAGAKKITDAQQELKDKGYKVDE